MRLWALNLVIEFIESVERLLVVGKVQSSVRVGLMAVEYEFKLAPKQWRLQWRMP